MAPLKNSFTSRSVIKNSRAYQITLPADDLAEFDVSRGDLLAAPWTRADGELSIILEPYEDVDALHEEFPDAVALEVVPVGDSLGCSIPSEVRFVHGISDDDELLLEGDNDLEGWRIDLERSETRAIA